MSQNEQDESRRQFEQEGEALLIKGRVTKLESEQEEARRRDEHYKKLQIRYNKRVAWFTLGLVCTSLVTNVIYLDMSCTARKNAETARIAAYAARDSAALTRQQLIATQATILHVRFQVSFQLVASGPFAQGLRAITESVSGSAMATDIHESFDVCWKTIPKLRDISKPEHFDFVIPEFRKDESNTPYVTGVPFDGLTSDLWEPIRIGKSNRTIQISGTFRYKNGFEQVPEQTFCFIWYSHPTVFRTMYQDFVDCSEYRSHVGFFAAMERKEAEAQSQHKQ